MVNFDMNIVDKVVGKIKGSADKIPTVSEVIPPKKKIKDEPELSKAEKSYSMAQLAYKSKDYRTAMMHARDTIINNKKLSGPYLIIADCYMDNKMYLNALRVVNKGIEAIGGFDLYEKIEEVYEAQGKRKEIRKMWDNYIMSSRKKDLGYRALGLFYEEKEKDPEMAIQYYKKTIEANPVHIDIYERLAALYFRTEQMQEAINVYDDLLFSKHAKEFFRNSTNKSRILTKVGEIYFLKRQFDFAFKYFDMALQAVPGNKDVYNRLGDMAYYVQDKKNTLKYYKLAYQADETDIEFIIKHAISNIMNDKPEEALPLFKRIQRYNPLITGIKQIVETLEEKNEINEEYFRILVEENTDLLLDYRYEKDFKFPESREELDNFRKKYNSIDAKLDFDDEGEAPHKKQETENGKQGTVELETGNRELEEQKVENREKEVGDQNQNSQLDSKNESLDPRPATRDSGPTIEENNGEKVIRLRDQLSKKKEEREKKMEGFGFNPETVEQGTVNREQETVKQTVDGDQNQNSPIPTPNSQLDSNDDFLDEINKLNQELEQGTVNSETVNRETEEQKMESREKGVGDQDQNSQFSIDNSQLDDENSNQSIPQPSTLTPNPEISNETISSEEIQEIIKKMQDYVNSIQGISQRVLQINNIMPEGKIPEDNIKKNIVKIALENIESDIQKYDVKEIKKGISRLRKIL